LLGKLRVTAQEGQFLAFVSVREGVSVTAVCRLLGLPKSTVTSLLKRLEKAGLTHRGLNPEDGRSWLVLRQPKAAAQALLHVTAFWIWIGEFRHISMRPI
jgi:DNA-binding MarR family transcriptional regulator